MGTRQTAGNRPRQPAVPLTTTGGKYPLVDALIAAGFTVDQGRFDRVFSDPRGNGNPIHGNVALTAGPGLITGTVKGVYHTSLTLDPATGQVMDCDCDCPDWLQSGGKAARIPCKHILGTAVDAPQPVLAAPQPAPAPAEPAPAPLTAPDPDTRTFNEKVRRAIGQAISKLADQVEALLKAGETPFLIGPTGCGKTSAVRLVATRNNWGLEEVAGAPSFADADLVGIHTNQMEHTGIFARAFRRARGGETVLVFLDELTRFNIRVPDLLMRPLLPIGHDVAWALQIPAEEGESVRLIEAPVWGVEWAPAARTPLVLAANPWGSSLDPALVRRAVPLEIGFAPEVAAQFQGAARTIIETSWQLVTEGQLPLPVEYQALGRATDPGAIDFVAPYLARLRAVDRPAAEGFRNVLTGIGVHV